MSSPFIQEHITSRNIGPLFSGKQSQKVVKTLNYQNGPSEKDPFGACWTVQLMSVFPKGRDEIICIFPNHKEEKKKIIKASSYFLLTSLNKDINLAFSNSHEKTGEHDRRKLAIAYGNCIFDCKEIQGSIYIIYAEYMTRVNQGNVPNTAYENFPLIVNVDGQNRLKSIFVLKKDVKYEFDLHFLPHAPGNPVIRWPRDPIFVCESKPEEQKKEEIPTLSRVVALQTITMPTKGVHTWLPYEKNVFLKEVKDNNDDDEDEGDNVELTLTDTPDEYFVDTSGGEQPMQRTVSLLRGVTEVFERDPFEEDDQLELQQEQKTEYIELI